MLVVRREGRHGDLPLRILLACGQYSASLRTRPLQIQRQQLLQYPLVRDVVRPAVSVEHGVIQLAVRQLKPRRTLVVQVGEGALLEVGLGSAWGVEPVV